MWKLVCGNICFVGQGVWCGVYTIYICVYICGAYILYICSVWRCVMRGVKHKKWIGTSINPAASYHPPLHVCSHIYILVHMLLHNQSPSHALYDMLLCTSGNQKGSWESNVSQRKHQLTIKCLLWFKSSLTTNYAIAKCVAFLCFVCCRFELTLGTLSVWQTPSLSSLSRISHENTLGHSALVWGKFS